MPNQDQYQIDQRNATQLIKDAEQEDFIETLVERRNRLEVINRYTFTSDFSEAFLNQRISHWEELVDAVLKIMRRLYPREEKGDTLGGLRVNLEICFMPVVFLNPTIIPSK